MSMVRIIAKKLAAIRRPADVVNACRGAPAFLGRLWRSSRDWAVPRHTRHLAGPLDFGAGPDDVVVLCLVRDGQVYVKSYVEHYLALGAKHLCVLDNGSTDATVERFSRYPQVTVLQSLLPYRRYQHAFMRYLYRRFAPGSWGLLADIDELFDYPYSEHIPLPALARYLREHGYTAVLAHMLDMFGDTPPSDQPPPLDLDLRARYRRCAPALMRQVPYAQVFDRLNVAPPDVELCCCYGGAQQALFGADTILSKHPLVRIDGQTVPCSYSSHHASNVRLADFTAILRHYKLLDGFQAKVRRVAAEENYAHGSARYKKIQQALTGQDVFRLAPEAVRELRQVSELLDAGLLVASARYRAWAAAQAAAPDNGRPPPATRPAT